MQKPSHYIVIKSPFAQQILDGSKGYEYRPEASARAMGGKTLAIAVSKAPASPEAGMIIGQATFGNPVRLKGTMALSIKEYELWPEDKWLPSPGGLGVRPLPATGMQEEPDVEEAVAEEPAEEVEAPHEEEASASIGVSPMQKEVFERLAAEEGLSVGDYLFKAVRTTEWVLKEWGS